MVLGLKYVLLLFVIIASFLALPISAEPSHLLDGKTFSGQNGEKGNKADRDDELIFENGKFISTSCYDYDFESGDYTTSVEGDVVHFDAVTISPEHGKLTWNGAIKNDKMEATFVWTKERWYWDVRREYWFKGDLKQ